MDEAAPQAARLADVLASVLEGEITADMLRATFDHWRIFQKGGRWWAMRSGDATGEGPRSLIHPLVRSVTLEGLAEQLSLQEWLRRMTAQELETVWRNGFAEAGR